MTQFNFKTGVKLSVSGLAIATLMGMVAVASEPPAAPAAAPATVGGKEDGAAYNDVSGAAVVSADAGTGDGKGIENVVTVSGMFNGKAYSNDAFENVDVVAADPKVSIVKSATLADGSAIPATGVKVADTIKYTYVVTNTGNVTLKPVDLSDNHVVSTSSANSLSAITCDETVTTDNLTTGDTNVGTTDNLILQLGAQDVVTCSATYVVTQADVDDLQ